MISRNLLCSISLMLLIDSIGISVIFPILPELFFNTEIGFYLDDIYLTKETLYSLSFALFSLSAMFGMPILGSMSDKLGRNEIIIYVLVALALNYLLSIISILIHSVWLFLLTRSITGFLSGTYSIGDAIISELSTNDEERISNFKLPTIASISGFILGPVLSIFIYKLNIGNPLVFPFVVVFILSIVNLILFLGNSRNLNLKFPHTITLAKFESNDKVSNTLVGARIETKNLFASLIYIFNNQYIRSLALSFSLFEFGCGLLLESLSLYLTLTFDYKPSQIGRFFVIMGIIMATSMYLLYKLIIKYIDYIVQLKIGLILTSVTLLASSILYNFMLYEGCFDHIYIIWLTTTIFYILFPFTTLGFTNLFASSTGNEGQGRINGSKRTNIFSDLVYIWINNRKISK